MPTTIAITNETATIRTVTQNPVANSSKLSVRVSTKAKGTRAMI